MQNSEWYDVKFLESATNLKALIKRSVGRTPSTSIATQIAICIQQGRLFFEAATSAPLQIKPLQLYYGVLAFSKAVVLARNISSLDALIASHGLLDISANNSRVEELKLKVGTRGAFQEFNDAVAALGRIWHFENAMLKWQLKPFDSVQDLDGFQISITEIFSRIPGLSHSFQQTFGSRAKSWPIGLDFHSSGNGQCDLRIDDPELFSDRESLVMLVRKWRTDYSFLNEWSFSEATHAWNKSVLIFQNFNKESHDDLALDSLIQGNDGFVTSRVMLGSQRKWISALEILPPLAGGITLGHQHVIQPINSIYLSEFSLQFLASYLLSSLVRYRPQTWQHAISRSITTDKPADDRSLALVEQFLSEVLSGFPKLVIHAIDYTRLS
jgi:hypothetical protein